MRTIIAGSRNCTDYDKLLYAIKHSCNPSVILSGAARGADSLGERWAKENNMPLELYPAEWYKYGKSAGYKRNVIMAENAHALIALWDGKSKGTSHMIDIAKSKGLKVFIFNYGISNCVPEIIKQRSSHKQ